MVEREARIKDFLFGCAKGAFYLLIGFISVICFVIINTLLGTVAVWIAITVAFILICGLTEMG